MDTTRKHQVKSRNYYLFWGIISVAVVGMTSALVHSNYKQAESNQAMAEAIHDYILIKPFPLLCRGQIQ